MLSLALLRSQARSTADLAHSRAISTSLAQSSNILSKMAVINPTVQLYSDALQVSGWQQVSWQDSTQTGWLLMLLWRTSGCKFSSPLPGVQMYDVWSDSAWLVSFLKSRGKTPSLISILTTSHVGANYLCGWAQCRIDYYCGCMWCPSSYSL